MLVLVHCLCGVVVRASYQKRWYLLFPCLPLWTGSKHEENPWVPKGSLIAYYCPDKILLACDRQDCKVKGEDIYFKAYRLHPSERIKWPQSVPCCHHRVRLVYGGQLQSQLMRECNVNQECNCDTLFHP